MDGLLAGNVKSLARRASVFSAIWGTMFLIELIGSIDVDSVVSGNDVRF